MINDLVIDSEWRSDLKWERLIDAIQSLHGRTVLDVGCGNGFYLSKMVDEGAELALGIDPTRLFFYQFEAIAQLTGSWALPSYRSRTKISLQSNFLIPYSPWE